MNPLTRDLLRRAWPWLAYLAIHAGMMGALLAHAQTDSSALSISPIFPAVLMLSTGRVNWAGLMTHWTHLPVTRDAAAHAATRVFWVIPSSILVLCMGLAAFVPLIFLKRAETRFLDALVLVVSQPILLGIALVVFAWTDARPASRLVPGLNVGWSWRWLAAAPVIPYILWTGLQPTNWDRFLGWRGLLLLVLAPLALKIPAAMKAMIWGWPPSGRLAVARDPARDARAKALEFKALAHWLRPNGRASSGFPQIQRILTLMGVLDIALCWFFEDRLNRDDWASIGVALFPFLVIIGPLATLAVRLQNARALALLPRPRRWLSLLAWRPLAFTWVFLCALYLLTAAMEARPYEDSRIWAALSIHVIVLAVLAPVGGLIAIHGLFLRRPSTTFPAVFFGFLMGMLLAGPSLAHRAEVSSAHVALIFGASGLGTVLLLPYLHARLGRRLPNPSFAVQWGGPGGARKSAGS